MLDDDAVIKVTGLSCRIKNELNKLQLRKDEFYIQNNLSVLYDEENLITQSKTSIPPSFPENSIEPTISPFKIDDSVAASTANQTSLSKHLTKNHPMISNAVSSNFYKNELERARLELQNMNLEKTNCLYDLQQMKKTSDKRHSDLLANNRTLELELLDAKFHIKTLEEANQKLNNTIHDNQVKHKKELEYVKSKMAELKEKIKSAAAESNAKQLQMLERRKKLCQQVSTEFVIANDDLNQSTPVNDLLSNSSLFEMDTISHLVDVEQFSSQFDVLINDKVTNANSSDISFRISKLIDLQQEFQKK